MDDIRVPRDDILDFSYLPKEHQFINMTTCFRIRDHMVKRTQTRKNFEKIVSCYRYKNEPGTFRSCDKLFKLPSFGFHEILFPLWILAALNMHKDKILTIVEITVAHFDGTSMIPDTLLPVNELSLNEKNLPLIIGTLNVVCDGCLDDDEITDQKELIKKFLKNHDIECEEDQIFFVSVDDSYFFQKLNCIETTSHESPHIMFGSCCGISNVYQPLPMYGNRFGNGILIATLGYGYNEYPFLNSDDEKRCRPIAVHRVRQSLVPRPEDSKSQEPNTFDYWLTSPWIIHDYTKTSEFIVCKTTDDDGFIVNGATARALNYLKKVWEKQKVRYNNLVVLIPYGGQYMKDEMEAIYEATNEGIIIVCAAGREGGDVVFPAALGTVISVGVAGTGPKGREIDVSIDFTARPAKLLNCYKKEVELPRDCGIAAARVVGLISLLLSHINSIMKAPEEISSVKKMAKYIRDSKPNAYLHTYVIRELLVNESNGLHDPQLGYGDGEQIILSLLDMKPSFLIQKLANIVCGHSITGKGNIEDDTISAEEKSEKFHDLEGENICVGIIDLFENLGSIKTSNWQPHPKDLPVHGDKCAMVLRNISSKCQILCLNTQSSSVVPVINIFNACKSEDYKAIDVITCSVSFPIFYLDLCIAVDNAVKAGKIIVFAAGNCGLSQQNSIDYPGRNGNIIVVGRGDRYYNRARYTSAGREMDFLAQVQCVKPNQASSGTSFAAPVVAGYIALLLEFIQKMESDKIEVWSGKEWKEIPISEAARNVYAMRALLKLLVVKPQVHSETEGFGCLNFSVLFPEYIVDGTHLTQSDAKLFSTELAKERIRQTLKKFYKREA